MKKIPNNEIDKEQNRKVFLKKGDFYIDIRKFYNKTEDINEAEKGALDGLYAIFLDQLGNRESALEEILLAHEELDNILAPYWYGLRYILKNYGKHKLFIEVEDYIKQMSLSKLDSEIQEDFSKPKNSEKLGKLSTDELVNEINDFYKSLDSKKDKQ